MVGRENQKSFLCTRLHLKKPFVFLLCCSRKKNICVSSNRKAYTFGQHKNKNGIRVW